MSTSPPDSRHTSATSALGTVGPRRRDVSPAESLRANRLWWDADAEEYHQAHGDFLGVDTRDGEFVWCPEGLHEGDVGLLGDVTDLDVLEVGCGSAPCSRWLVSRGARAVGLDLSAGMLARGVQTMRAGGPQVPLVQASADALPFADGSFDIACSAFGAVPFVADSAAVMA
ncbi:MAG: class I SAM-dependent methyltransferase, partial [Mycobacteriaceae bacterium]